MNDYNPDALPPVIVGYLQHADPELFSDDARVLDEGIEHHGIAAIREWRSTTASAYTYTTTYTGQEQVDAQRWIVRAHLEGDFPGGVVDLIYRFTVASDRIVDLAITP